MPFMTAVIEYRDDLIAGLRERFRLENVTDPTKNTDREFTVNIARNDLRSMVGRTKRGFVRVTLADVAASQTIDADHTAAVAATDTLTIAGKVLSAVASVTTENQFLIGATDAAYVANVVACINANSVTSKIVYAEAVDSNTFRITCKFPGPIGNLVTLAEAGNGFTLGGAVLASGASDANNGYSFGYTP